jgi:hypothetical protein
VDLKGKLLVMFTWILRYNPRQSFISEFRDLFTYIMTEYLDIKKDSRSNRANEPMELFATEYIQNLLNFGTLEDVNYILACGISSKNFEILSRADISRNAIFTKDIGESLWNAGFHFFFCRFMDRLSKTDPDSLSLKSSDLFLINRYNFE